MKEEIRELVFAIVERAMEKGFELQVEQKDSKNELLPVAEGNTRTFTDNGFIIRIFRCCDDEDC